MTATLPAATTLRPVICVPPQPARDRAAADDSVRGRFTHHGWRQSLGRHPDWLAVGEVADAEWRIEYVKFYVGHDLAAAFAQTGDVEYLRTWEDLVESFLDQVPVGHDSSDVSARRVQHWLYARQAFAAAPAYGGLRAGLAERLAARIAADCAHLAAHLTAERNHRTLELYTLLLAGLALGEPARAIAALDLLADNAARDIWVDGVHRECSSDYHLLVLRTLVGAIANARAAGLPVPEVLLDRTHRACDVALHLQRPDGRTPALSDSDCVEFGALLGFAANLLQRPDLAWVASRGRTGVPPEHTNVSFPVGGYHVQRSGWASTAERFAVLDCGPLGDGGHGHYDQLALELYAGAPFVVDPGRYTYDARSPWRHWFKGTPAHNTVTVDGRDQTPYRPGKPKGAQSVARLLGRWSRPGLDVLCGEVRSPAYDAVHTRTVGFVAGEFWIVHDRLRAPTPHRYAARWQLAPPAHGRTTVESGAAQTAVRSPVGALVVPAGHGSVGLEEGWVAPSYGVKHPAPVLAVRSAGRDADLITVLVPGGLVPAVSVLECARDTFTIRVGPRTVRWNLPAGRLSVLPC